MVYTNKIDDEIVFHGIICIALYLEKSKKYIPLFEGKRIFFEGWGLCGNIFRETP